MISSAERVLYTTTKHQSKWWFPTAFSHWDDQEWDAIQTVLDSGQLTMGPQVEAFEHELACAHGRKYAVMTNSGSSANLIMIAALFELEMLKRGDTAAVPALAWSTTYAPLVQHGLKLKLIDIGDTWNAKWEGDFPCDLEVVCSILGNPAFHGHQTSSTFGSKPVVIEDNCESLGARIGDMLMCGTMGLMSSLSFFYSHQISAVEGGAVLTDDSDCAAVLKMLRAHGWAKDLNLPTPTFEYEYDFRLFGYNVRPVEMHAAIARVQLRKLSRFIAARQSNLRLFKKLTEGMPIKHQLVSRDSHPSPFGLAFMVADGATRYKLAAAFRANGIDCRPPTGGSFRMHHYGQNWSDQSTPQADQVHRCGIFLGNAPYSIDEKVGRAVAVMKEVL